MKMKILAMLLFIVFCLPIKAQETDLATRGKMEKQLKIATMLAGDYAVKVIIKRIEVDTDNKQNFICDLVKAVKSEDGELSEVIYYENAAYTLEKLPFKLTKKELDELNGVVE